MIEYNEALPLELQSFPRTPAARRTRKQIKLAKEHLTKKCIDMIYTIVMNFKEINNHQFNIGISCRHPVFNKINEIIGNCEKLGDRNTNLSELILLLGI